MGDNTNRGNLVWRRIPDDIELPDEETYHGFRELRTINEAGLSQHLANLKFLVTTAQAIISRQQELLKKQTRAPLSPKDALELKRINSWISGKDRKGDEYEFSFPKLAEACDSTAESFYKRIVESLRPSEGAVRRVRAPVIKVNHRVSELRKSRAKKGGAEKVRRSG